MDDLDAGVSLAGLVVCGSILGRDTGLYGAVFAYFLLVLPGCRATVYLALCDTRGRFQQPCDALGCFRDDRTYLGELVCGSRFWVLRRLLR